MRTSLKLRSGATIPCISKRTAQEKHMLTRTELGRLHLMPKGEPAAFCNNADDTLLLFFDSDNVVEAPPELWYRPATSSETMTLPSGNVIEKMGAKRAATLGFYTAERLKRMNLEPVEEPTAYTVSRHDRSTVYFYDKKTAAKLPLMCVKCGQAVRVRKKLCEACYEEDLAVRREEGNAYRNAYYGMARERILFFDLELTGFYDRDEIISITIINGKGELIMNTLVKPSHTKKWKKTEKIHNITPEMVADAPLLSELTDRIKDIFAGADKLIAYGVSTDFSHIKYIYETEAEREALHAKVHCCANEFVRYIHVTHASLSDAMACLGIEWEGVAHSSIADTYGCWRVWEALFPHYYAD